jgi:hypothetical protein
MINDGAVQVITAAVPSWIFPFTELTPAQFRRLVRQVAERGGEQIADGRPGRQWSLDMADRVLLVATCWRTNLTMRPPGPLFGISHSAVHRMVDSLETLLALSPVRRRKTDQIAIDANTRLVIGPAACSCVFSQVTVAQTGRVKESFVAHAPRRSGSRR